MVANHSGRAYVKFMARPRKRHVQQPLYFGDKNGQRRGDPRGRKRTRGVKLGRPPKGPRSSERHEVRETFKPSQPLHVTLRAIDKVGRLRTAAVYRAIREALIMTLWRESCRVVQLSIQHNHVHLLVEAENRAALSRGMQGFQISAAKHINAEISKGRLKGISWYEAKRRGLIPAERQRRKGTVFPDRYHVEVIKTPRQARNAIAYVLNNWRKHDEHRDEKARGWLIDPFATGWSFDGWKEREDEPFVWKLRETYAPMPSWRPRTWLLQESWRRYGLIRTHEVPGPRAKVFPS